MRGAGVVRALFAFTLVFVIAMLAYAVLIGALAR
jgi:hypothetical protein